MTTVLALEFSSDRRSVAVVRSGVVLAESAQTSGRSTRVFSLISEALQRARLTPVDVDTLAVGVGPGSYTGIRLAISVVQGWSLAGREPRTLSVGSFEVLAAEISGPAWVVADAQRGEWAVAPVDEGRVLKAARLLSAADVVTLARTARVIGPEVVQALGVGETLYPTARTLGVLAEARGAVVLPEALAAVYLRAAAFVKAPLTRSIPGITDVVEPTLHPAT